MFLILDGNNLAWAGYYGLERAMKPESPERRQRVALLGLSSMALGAIARAGEPPVAPPSGRAADAAQGSLFDEVADDAGARGLKSRGAGVSVAGSTGGSAAKNALTRVAVCFDTGRPLKRRELFPAYQTGREGDPKFIENEPTILAAIEEFAAMCVAMLPVEVLRGENTEADDLIAGLVHHNPRVAKRIVSTDRDFLQLVGPKLSVYAPVKKVVIDESNFNAEAMPKTSAGETVAFPRERFLDYRALTGDPSDNVPGVPGIGPLSAAKMLAGGKLDRYFGKPDAVRAALTRKSAAVEAAFADGTAQAIVERNRTLMDLRRAAPCWADLPSYTKRGRWDRAAFDGWLEEEKVNVERPLIFERIEALAP
jgi:5'-3' exonuclease